MALKRLTIDGYGQIELNNVAFRRDGRIEAQCKPDAVDFKTDKVENGMILAIDNITRTVKYPSNDGGNLLGLVYSSEHIYDERTPGLKNFALNGSDDFLPRLGLLAVGDKWTSNCLAYDTSEFATEDDFINALKAYATTPLYGGITEIGAIKVSATAPLNGTVLKVIKKTTMPDGSLGVKFQAMAC